MFDYDIFVSQHVTSDKKSKKLIWRELTKHRDQTNVCDLETRIGSFHTYLDCVVEQPQIGHVDQFYIEIRKKIADDRAVIGLECFMFYITGNMSHLALWWQTHVSEGGETRIIEAHLAAEEDYFSNTKAPEGVQEK